MIILTEKNGHILQRIVCSIITGYNSKEVAERFNGAPAKFPL
jgi:hypothetical protein